MRSFRMLACCGAVLWGAAVAAGGPAEKDRPLIICSTTQVADFARQIVGDRFQVRSVLAPNQDPHQYKIKPGDARLVAQAVLCLENGWHLEGHDWMKKLAKDANKPIVSCIEGVKPLELPTGQGEKIKDPHAWFSPRNAVTYVENIRRAVTQVDSAHADEYRSRAKLYINQLKTLDLWIRSEVRVIPLPQRKLITSHDAFQYFCLTYGFESAAPAGWSTGQEVGGGVTPERRKLVVDSIRKFQVKAIFVETSVNKKLIQQIAKDAGVEVGGELYSDSMGPAGSAGETYLGMMRENVLKIVQALK